MANPILLTDTLTPGVEPRVEPLCQLPSLLVHWSYRERNTYAILYTHAMLYKCGGVRRLKHGMSGLQLIAFAGGTDLYFK